MDIVDGWGSVEGNEATPSIAMRPCAMALAAMSVPAQRWDTRTDLIVQLAKAERYVLEVAPEEFCLSAACQIAGLSLHHFLRLFHEVYGVTPRQFVAIRKVEGAKRLLVENDANVAEVAVEVGFSNASAFSRFFRIHAGCSPSEFRKRRVFEKEL